jgi:Mg-chelatase subunit ChlD
LTVTPSSTPTVAATDTPTPTATRFLPPVYLPLLLTEECKPARQHADVALVIDASTSMRDRTRVGRTKLTAATEAVRRFLDGLALPLDQAAIVQFNGGGELLQPLTGDGLALVASLDRIEVQRQTRIDLGIQVACEELKSGRRRVGNEAVMIVLTDGKANPVGPDAAVREAAAAKAEKVTIFTIGRGEDLDLAALEAIASKPSYSYHAPDAEDLAEIYSKIAVEIPCPATDFWGRR